MEHLLDGNPECGWCIFYLGFLKVSNIYWCLLFSSEILLVAYMANNAQFPGMQVVHLKDLLYMFCVLSSRLFLGIFLYVNGLGGLWCQFRFSSDVVKRIIWECSIIFHLYVKTRDFRLKLLKVAIMVVVSGKQFLSQ